MGTTFKYTVSRDLARKIKNMNREQLESYLSTLYTDAFHSGVDAMKNEVVSRIDSGLKNAEGVGKKRYESIMSSINEEFNKEVV